MKENYTLSNWQNISLSLLHEKIDIVKSKIKIILKYLSLKTARLYKRILVMWLTIYVRFSSLVKRITTQILFQISHYLFLYKGKGIRKGAINLSSACCLAKLYKAI